MKTSPWNAKELKKEITISTTQTAESHTKTLEKISTSSSVYGFYSYDVEEIMKMEESIFEVDTFYRKICKENKWTKQTKATYVELLNTWNMHLEECINNIKTFVRSNETANENQLVEVGIAKGFIHSLQVMTYRNTSFSKAMEWANTLEKTYSSHL
ncbi:hypothetical protein CN918_30660 [Priestia megaterium]|nr:hypothetical protein CN918_30660 [Priestia megaterium]